TRGAAVLVVHVDTRSMRAACCGVGNVRIRELPTRGGRGTSLPGIVGLKMPALRVFESKLYRGDLLIFHTDGIAVELDRALIRDLPVEDIPRVLALQHGLPHDDATVVTLRAITGP